MNAKKLFGIGVLVSFLVSLILIKLLPVYNGGIGFSTETHRIVFIFFLSAVLLYSTFVFWMHLKHRSLFKGIVIPILIVFSFFIGSIINYLVCYIMSAPFFSFIVHNWIFNMEWFFPFSISLAAAIIFYIETVLFNWVRAGNKAL